MKLTDHLAGKTLNDWAFLSAVEAAKCVPQEMMLLAAAFHQFLYQQHGFEHPFKRCEFILPEITPEMPLETLCIGKYEPIKPFLKDIIVDDVTDEFWLRCLLPKKFNTLASELYTCIVKNRV